MTKLEIRFKPITCTGCDYHFGQFEIGKKVTLTCPRCIAPLRFTVTEEFYD